MNKIEEIRKKVITENNDAQHVLGSFLDELDSTTVTELRFDFPLHGEVDFSILADRGFKKVRLISFDRDGDITHLRNLPETLVYLHLNKQLVTEFDKLPSNIETLNVADNYISKFDAAMVPKLRTLNISNNELTQLLNLPETLETLECENNQLRRLDLANTPSLKNLVCSNNPILVLEHVPASLTNLVMENNPFVEISHSQPNPKTNKRTDKMLDYRESLNEYLRLKNVYETKARKLKRTAFEKGATRREGKRNVQIVKIPCVNCHRNVGTQFLIEGGYYYALCGDRSKPCKLDIQIFGGDHFPLDEMLSIYNEDIQTEKQKIIEQKMDTLFKYIDETTSARKFKEALEQYTATSNMRSKYMGEYDKIFNNAERTTQLDNKIAEMYRIREDIAKLFAVYKESGNREIMIAAIQMYVKDLVPAIQSMRLVKYDSVFVETTNSDPPISILVSHEIARYRNDVFIGEPPKVVKFIVD